MMNSSIKYCLGTAALWFAGAAGATDNYSYYGYSPINCREDMMSAQGTGKNGYVESAICIDPTSEGVAARLKGNKVVGVRCYLRSDYKNKNKGTSTINIRQGSLDAEPQREAVDFSEGWNELMFENPVEISDEPIYVGFRVYERSGTPYPIVSATGASLDGGYFFRGGKENWEQIRQSGTVLVQAIVDRAPEDMPDGAMATIYNVPNVVEPDSQFPCSLYFHNLSGHEVTEAVVSVSIEGGEEVGNVNVKFDTPVAPFDSQTVEVTIPTGTELGASVPYVVKVESVDGKELEGMLESTLTLHVTQDAFLRIPLIEEFTSFFCTNCPFMAYYLDKAMEEFEGPHVFIARHAGFVEDALTNNTDRELVYLFGGTTYNPGVMYDRVVESEVGGSPVKGANVADVAPYAEALENASKRVALAKIIVNADFEGDKVNVSVEGRLATGVDTEGLYISTCLVESDIPLSAYPQMGLDPLPEGAPDDLVESYRHNGVVRHSFNVAPLGDVLSVNADNTFNVSYDAASIKTDWNSDNLEVVSFICRVNKDNLADNYVLNAGGNRWNKYVNSGVSRPEADFGNVWIGVNPDGTLVIPEGMENVNVYGIDGRRFDVNEALPAGVCIVTGMADGRKVTRKILVK